MLHNLFSEKRLWEQKFEKFITNYEVKIPMHVSKELTLSLLGEKKAALSPWNKNKTRSVLVFVSTWHYLF